MFFKIQQLFSPKKINQNENLKANLITTLKSQLSDVYHLNKEVAISSIRIQDVINYLKSNCLQIETQYDSIRKDSLEAALHENELLLDQLIEDELKLKYTYDIYKNRINELGILLEHLKEGAFEIEMLIESRKNRILFAEECAEEDIKIEEYQYMTDFPQDHNEQVREAITQANKLLSKYQQIPRFKHSFLKSEDIKAAKENILAEVEANKLITNQFNIENLNTKKRKRSEAMTQKEKHEMFHEFLKEESFTVNQPQDKLDKAHRVLDAFLNSSNPILHHKKRS